MKFKGKLGQTPEKKLGKDQIDKRLYILGFVISILIIGALLLYADISFEEKPLAAPESGGALCGNGLIEPRENCGNCFIDVYCGKDSLCINSLCLEKKASLLPWMIILILIILGSDFYLVYKIMEGKKKEDSADLWRISPLINYIGKALRAGAKEPEININSSRAGWTRRDIKIAMNVAKKRFRR